MANLRSIGLLFLLTAWTATLPCASVAQTSAGADGNAALAAAEKLYNAGRWAEAVRAYEDFQIRFPQHPQAVNAPFEIAESLVQLGEFERARSLFIEYSDKATTEEKKALTLFRIGECSFFLNEFDRSQKDLDTFRSLYPNHEKDSYAIGYLGDILLLPDQPDAAAAKKLFQEGLAKYSKKTGKNAAEQAEFKKVTEECRLGLGRAQAAAGEIPQAISTFKQMADNNQNPLAAEARIRLGRLYYDGRRFGEAVTALTPFVKAPKTNGPNPNRNWGLYWLGRTYLDRANQGDGLSAVNTLKLIEIPKETSEDPPVAAVAYYLGEAYRAEGQFDLAIKRFEKTFLDYPDSEFADDAFLSAMRVAFDKQDFKKVTGEYFPLASQQFSASSLYPYMDQLVGQVFLKTEKYIDAQSTFENLTQRFPKGGDPAKAEGDETILPTAFTNDNWLFLALSEIGLRRADKALAALKKIAPNSADAGGDFEMAVTAAEANANVLLGKYREAIAPLQEYLRVRGNDMDAAHYYELLALCQIMDNQPMPAQKSIEQLRKLDVEKIGGVETILKSEQKLAIAAAKQNEKELARNLYTSLTFRENPREYIEFGEDGLGRLNSGRAPVDGENVADSAPLSGRADEQAAFTLFKEGIRAEELSDYEKALENYVTVYTNHATTSEAPKALLAAGRILDRGQKDAEAAKVLQKLVDQYPNFPQLDLAWYRLAWTLVESGDLKASQSAFHEVVEAYPQSTLWADAAYRVAEYESASGHRDVANKLLDDILRQGETSAGPTRLLDHVLFLRAQNALAEHKWTIVEKNAAQLLKETPKSPLALSAQYLSAEAAYKSRDWKTAQDRFAALAQNTQGRTETWLPIIPLRQAQILAWRQKWQDAYDAAEDIQRNYPNFERMHEVEYLMGRCLMQVPNFTGARKHFDRVIAGDGGKRSESAAMSQWMSGETYFRQKEYEKAINAYNQVQEHYDFPYWQSVAMLQIGKCYLQLGDQARASTVLGDLVTRFPKSPYAAEAEKLRKSALSQSAVTRNAGSVYR